MACHRTFVSRRQQLTTPLAAACGAAVPTTPKQLGRRPLSRLMPPARGCYRLPAADAPRVAVDSAKSAIESLSGECMNGRSGVRSQPMARSEKTATLTNNPRKGKGDSPPFAAARGRCAKGDCPLFLYGRLLECCSFFGTVHTSQYQTMQERLTHGEKFVSGGQGCVKYRLRAQDAGGTLRGFRKPFCCTSTSNSVPRTSCSKSGVVMTVVVSAISTSIQ